MSIAIVKYVDEDGVHNAIIDNPWGGSTHIAADSPSALDMAIERERRFLKFVTGSSVSEPIDVIEDDPSVIDEPPVNDCI